MKRIADDVLARGELDGTQPDMSELGRDTGAVFALDPMPPTAVTVRRELVFRCVPALRVGNRRPGVSLEQ